MTTVVILIWRSSWVLWAKHMLWTNASVVVLTRKHIYIITLVNTEFITYSTITSAHLKSVKKCSQPNKSQVSSQTMITDYFNSVLITGDNGIWTMDFNHDNDFVDKIKGSFKVFYINIQSIRSKPNEIDIYILIEF